MESKQCSKCKEIKSIDEFGKKKSHKDGYDSWCKKCIKGYRKKYYINNRDNELEWQKEWYKVNTEKAKDRANLWRLANPEKVKENRKKWAKNNPEKVMESTKKFAIANPEKIKEYSRKEQRIKSKNLFYRLNHRVSDSIGKALKGNKNGYHWETLVNYTLQNLKNHLEKQFIDDMSWDNMGKWHIDHILPQSLFQFETYDDREFKQCWSLANLQPLWAEENIRKGNRIA